MRVKRTMDFHIESRVGVSPRTPIRLTTASHQAVLTWFRAPRRGSRFAGTAPSFGKAALLQSGLLADLFAWPRRGAGRGARHDAHQIACRSDPPRFCDHGSGRLGGDPVGRGDARQSAGPRPALVQAERSSFLPSLVAVPLVVRI